MSIILLKKLLLFSALLLFMILDNASSCGRRGRIGRWRSHSSHSSHSSPSHSSSNNYHHIPSETYHSPNPSFSSHNSHSIDSGYHSLGGGHISSPHNAYNPRDVVAVREPQRNNWNPTYPLFIPHHHHHYSSGHSSNTQNNNPNNNENTEVTGTFENQDANNTSTSEQPETTTENWHDFFRQYSERFHILLDLDEPREISRDIGNKEEEKSMQNEETISSTPDSSDSAIERGDDVIDDQIVNKNNENTGLFANNPLLKDPNELAKVLLHDVMREIEEKSDHTKANVKRSINKHYETSRTSCGVSLCKFSQNYPLEEINDAINRVREILTSRSSFTENLKSRIDKEVLHYQPKTINIQSFYKKEYIAEGCRVNVNITRPLEGVSLDDKQTYYIVNLPSFQQQVELLKCDSGNLCNNIIGSPLAICQQTYREEKLLVVPLEKQWFDISDLKIKTFKVPNGCECRLYDNDIQIL